MNDEIDQGAPREGGGVNPSFRYTYLAEFCAFSRAWFWHIRRECPACGAVRWSDHPEKFTPPALSPCERCGLVEVEA